MADKGGQQVCFSFQIGLIKDKVTVDVTDLNLKYLKTLACSFVNQKFPDHEITRLAERLLVFRHDYTSDNILQVSFHISLCYAKFVRKECNLTIKIMIEFRSTRCPRINVSFRFVCPSPNGTYSWTLCTLCYLLF